MDTTEPSEPSAPNASANPAPAEWGPRGFLFQILGALPTAAYTCDAAGLITYYNEGAVAIWGRHPLLNDPRDRWCGSYHLFTAAGEPLRHDDCWMARTLRDDRPHNGGEVVIERPDGTRRWALAYANPLHDEHGRLVGAANILVDVSDQKQAEDRLSHQAMHDSLTGLPNRALLWQRLERLTAATAAAAAADDGGDGTAFALLLIDLDRFKEINDTCGHQYGDEVLRRLRPLLQSCVREGDTVARLGGDEFGILLPGADGPGAVSTADRILMAMSKPITVDGWSFDVGASIGITLSPEHGRDAHTLVQHADVAMYEAKRAKAGRRVFAPGAVAEMWSRRLRAAELRRGIDENQLRLHYQPKVDPRAGRVVGVEALVRWEHPRDGLLHPAEFLPLAERCGLIQPLDLWALREALRQGRAWARQGLALDIAFNLAPQSIQDGPTLDGIEMMLANAGPLARRMVVEVTEREVTTSPARTRAALERLRGLGARVALDDFGTGFSSLTHLRELPVDEMKVDRSFVQALVHNGRDERIVRSVVELGRGLGLDVVAEGVEDGDSLDRLLSFGCDLVQGFLFTRPLPAGPLEAWLEASPWPVAVAA